MIRRIAFMATLWIVAGCSAGSEPSNREPGGTSPADPSAAAKPSPGVIQLGPRFIDPVVTEIAGLASVAPAEVVVISAEAITFPNGGLGCPKPGFSYTQAQVDGYKIVAVVNGETYDYRGTSPGVFRRCT